MFRGGQKTCSLLQTKPNHPWIEQKCRPILDFQLPFGWELPVGSWVWFFNHLSPSRSVKPSQPGKFQGHMTWAVGSLGELVQRQAGLMLAAGDGGQFHTQSKKPLAQLLL